VLADERALGEGRAEPLAGAERQPQRGDMRAHREVGGNRSRDEVRARRLHPDVQMLAEVTVGPAVEPALANRSDVVRNQVAADLVTLVDRGPQRPAPRVERDPDGVAQAASELARDA